MRGCRRNQRPIAYALYGVGEELDEFGNKIKGFGPKQDLKLYYTDSKSEVSHDVFGASLDYDKVMISYDMKCPIDEYSKIWIGSDQYQVKKALKNLNSIYYAIKRVEAPLKNEQDH